MIHMHNIQRLPAGTKRVVGKAWRNSAARQRDSRAGATGSSTVGRMQQLMDTLKEDSANLFSDQGMDLSIYARNVDFQDPITNYSDIEGFAKNLKFLKSAFNPTYDMLDIKQVSDTDIAARWTMGFDVLPIKNSPLGKVWQPRMEFTGVTIYGTDDDGLIARHYDTWDSIAQQQYFSTEGFSDVLAQIFNFQRTPDLDGPDFTLLKRKKAYSIREYLPFLVAEAPVEAGTGGSSGREAAFRALAGYLFGGNQQRRALSMTTPVLSGAGRMQFVLLVDAPTDAPEPLPHSGITVRQEPGGLYAAIRFAGRANDELTQSKARELAVAMRGDGLEAAGEPLLLQYNDPSVRGPFRRNEVLLRIASGFDLWET